MGAEYPPSRENLVAAQRVLVQKHTSELRSNRYWTEILSTTQLGCVPQKQPGNGAAYSREWVDTVKVRQSVSHSFSQSFSHSWWVVGWLGGWQEGKEQKE